MENDLTSDRTTFERSIRTVIKSYSIGERFSTRDVIDWTQKILPDIRNPQANIDSIVNYIRIVNGAARGLADVVRHQADKYIPLDIPQETEEEIDRRLSEISLQLEKNREAYRTRYYAVDSYLVVNQEPLGIECVDSGEYAKIEER